MHAHGTDLSALAQDPLAASILAAAAGAAFLHAVLPTHWLPFVLVGRGQGWSVRRTLGAAALAGGAHVAVTVAAGALIVGVGLSLEQRFEGILVWSAAAVLAGLGLWYLLAAPKRVDGGVTGRRFASDRAALLSLVVMLGVYPSEAFLPIYGAAAPLGWSLFVVLSVVLLAATLAGMAICVGLGLMGAARLGGLARIERYERLILGLALLALAAAVVWLH